MKAILCTKYGPPDVLELKDVEKPVPRQEQVLVKIHAASINTADLSYGGALLVRLLAGFSKPKDPRWGKDIAGQVEVIGHNVTQFKAGDEVFGVCQGGFAEYGVTRESNLVLKPANITFEEAAAIPVAGITALQGLRDTGHVNAGEKVLICGASGGVGTFAVQIAKSFGADVTAVCSTRNVDQARSIGADHVIDYTKEDFIKNGQQYDLILTVNGYYSIFDYRRSLTPKGRYVQVGGDRSHAVNALFQAMLFGPMISRDGGQKLGSMGIARINQPDLIFLRDLVAARKIVPVIERRYPLSETVAAARYLEGGHAQGKVIITVIPEA